MYDVLDDFGSGPLRSAAKILSKKKKKENID